MPTTLTKARRSERLARVPVGQPAVMPAFAAPRVMHRKPELSFQGRRIHFMGAGGIGVSAMMELCAARGAIVSGCDCSSGGQVAQLKARGISVASGHCPSHVADCDELVHTAAVDRTHPEVKQAEADGKMITARMGMLGRIARGVRSICVTGAHGKTSTTWLIARVLMEAQRDPSVLVGGVVKELGGNVRVGCGLEFVMETDESDNKLHEVIPTIPVLTNIDNDHLEHYGTVENIEDAMVRFLGTTDPEDPLAMMIGCGDDPRVRNVLARAGLRSRKPMVEYGFGPNCMTRGVNVRAEGLGWRFDALGPYGLWQDLVLPMPGIHNVLNALAAVTVAWRLGISDDVVRRAFASIERVGRRFEIKGEKRGVRVVDDYGHHPTEIAVTLNAARASTAGRLAVLFQPHRYTRTAQLMPQFATCFSEADAVFLLPVYAASEQPIAGADHHAMGAAIRASGHRAVYTFNSRTEAIAAVLGYAHDGDTVVTQGAGDVTRASNELVAGL